MKRITSPISVLCEYRVAKEATINGSSRKVTTRLWEDARVTRVMRERVYIKYTGCGTKSQIDKKHLSNYTLVRFPASKPAINLEQIRLAFEFRKGFRPQEPELIKYYKLID